MAYSTYCVTFRLANEAINGLTYEDRRQQLIANVKSNGMGFWDEPTSFMLVESDLDTYAFGSAAVRGLSSSKDLVFIFDPSDKSACYFGAIQYAPVLVSFFPSAKKIS